MSIPYFERSANLMSNFEKSAKLITFSKISQIMKVKGQNFYIIPRRDRPSVGQATAPAGAWPAPDQYSAMVAGEVCVCL